MVEHDAFNLHAVLEAAADTNASLARLAELIAFRSVSSDPAHREDCIACCGHLASLLADLGFHIQIVATDGLPVLIARHDVGTGPTCLFYGHYDVQPAGDDASWSTPPFNMTMANGRIMGRGACDNKGQLMTFVEALRAWKVATGTLPVSVTILMEGEEEIGSPSLLAVLRDHAALLRADQTLLCDTSMWDADTPAICTSVRGLLNEVVELRVADVDLHSGAFGGTVPDAVLLMSKALAGLTDADGQILVSGFYDGVAPVDPTLRAEWAALDGGNAERLTALWAAPCLAVTGIAAGHAGPGHKTIIPATARAHLSIRLVGQQKPEKLRQTLRQHLNAALPDGLEFTFTAEASVAACTVPSDLPAVRLVRQALDNEWPNPTRLVGGAGTIPAVGMLSEQLGAQPIMVGFGLEDDQAHSPNEKFDLNCFTKGLRSWIRILAGLRRG